MSQHTAFWLDGAPTRVLPLPDRGVDFGDGVFETLLLHKGLPLHVDLHLARLARGLRVLAFPECLEAVRQHLATAVDSWDNAWRWAAMRLTVLRGPGPRGYAPAEEQVPRILVSVTPLARDCAKLSPAASMAVADVRLATQPALAHIKHLNRLEQVLAATQARAEQVDECFLLDQSGYLVSVIAGNVFMVSGGEILTPKLVDCGVAGTRRRLIMEEWAPAVGVRVREARLTLSDLNDADEVFFSNSLQTVRPVACLGDQRWGSHAVCEALFQRHLETLQ